MMPISSYKELLKTFSWDYEKRDSESWYIFLLMNPLVRTKAGNLILANLSYLNTRTDNVTFFMPGFSNTSEGILPYPSEHGHRMVYKDDNFGEVFFDEEGFLETIKWFEDNCSTYHYSEDLDLLIVKYRPKKENIFCVSSEKNYEECFDFPNMIIYNLDTLSKEGLNIIKTIMECKRIVESNAESERHIKKHLDNLIYDQVDNSDRFWHQDINVFVAGSKKLKNERDSVVSALIHLTNNSSRGYSFRIKTYEDFPRSLTELGRQRVYNDYISGVADYAIFILDGAVGGITFEEFMIAMEAYRSQRKPEIYVYYKSYNISRFDKILNTQIWKYSQSVIKIREYLKEIHQYYVEYSDIDNLKSHISSDFVKYSI